jgi:MFS family permease
MKGKSAISKTVFFLGLISLFTDMASEMIYPVLPLFMESIGLSIVGIGILEGIAQATAGLSKGYFGRWSDLSSRRMPFVQIGYGLSAISKPLLAFATSGYLVLAARFGDRLGKGIRTGARDALLSGESNDDNKGRVFGFHRAMDSFGAALGPLFALVFLWYYPEQYKTLFLLAFIPGLFAIASSFLIPKKKKDAGELKTRPKLSDLLSYFKDSSKKYKRLILGLLLFSLINSTDFFLLIYIKSIGFLDFQIIALYILYNLVFALAAYPAGSLADRFSLGIMFKIGVALFSFTYIGLAYSDGSSAWIIISLFAIYGLYAACTEGISKAWISKIVDGKEVGSAIGNYSALESIATMLASSIGGLIWFSFGATVFFASTGILALAIILYFNINMKYVSD